MIETRAASLLIGLLACSLVILGGFSFYISQTQKTPQHPFFWQHLSQQASQQLANISQLPLAERPSTLTEIKKTLDYRYKQTRNNPMPGQR